MPANKTTPAHPHPRYFIGIDPGAHGAVAVLDSLGDIVAIEDLPYLPAEGPEKRVNGVALAAILRRFCASAEAVLERPTARTPNARSMMSLGCSYGMSLGVLQCLGIPTLTPTPSSWKRKGAMNVSADKKESVEAARGLFQPLPKRLRHDKAEALLLAEYGRRLAAKKDGEGVK